MNWERTKKGLLEGTGSAEDVAVITFPRDKPAFLKGELRVVAVSDDNDEDTNANDLTRLINVAWRRSTTYGFGTPTIRTGPLGGNTASPPVTNDDHQEAGTAQTITVAVATDNTTRRATLRLTVPTGSNARWRFDYSLAVAT